MGIFRAIFGKKEQADTEPKTPEQIVGDLLGCVDALLEQGRHV
jgi:hypothetical protein